MSKAIAKLTIKMMSADDVHVTQRGEDAEALFMAATAVATIILNSSNGSRTKADVFARTAKVVIDGLINDLSRTILPLHILIPPPRQKSRTTPPPPGPVT